MKKFNQLESGDKIWAVVKRYVRPGRVPETDIIEAEVDSVEERIVALGEFSCDFQNEEPETATVKCLKVKVPGLDGVIERTFDKFYDEADTLRILFMNETENADVELFISKESAKAYSIRFMEGWLDTVRRKMREAGEDADAAMKFIEKFSRI